MAPLNKQPSRKEVVALFNRLCSDKQFIPWHGMWMPASAWVAYMKINPRFDGLTEKHFNMAISKDRVLSTFIDDETPNRHGVYRKDVFINVAKPREVPTYPTTMSQWEQYAKNGIRASS